MTRGAAAATGDVAIADAARSALEAGGGAVDAVIAAFAMAAALEPGTLLAPALALVAGTGVGGRAFDGRAGQPGRGAPRPRGHVGDADVPDGARVAAPRTLAMLALLHGYRGRSRLASLVAPAAARAAREGASARAEVLRNFGASGVGVMQRSAVQRALLAVGGPVAGGALTAEDLTGARPEEVEARAAPLWPGAGAEGAILYVVPWAISGEPDEASRAEGIVVADGNGVVVALGYLPAREGIAVPELELAVGKHAEPVRRGITRTAPGSPLPGSVPIAVLARAGGFHAAIFAPGRATLDAGDVPDDAAALPVEGLLAGLGAFAAVWDGRKARAVSGAPAV